MKIAFPHVDRAPKACIAAAYVLLFGIVAGAEAQSAPVPPKLEPAANESLAMTLAARGVQIYECRAKKDAPAEHEWAFVAPEAVLLGTSGQPAGKHGAGPSWQAPDGSKIVGTVKERADAPVAGAIPWLLLSAQSEGSDGSFSKVTSVQRVNTVGGVAPATGCDRGTAGTTARITYTADYRFFVAK